MNSPLIVPFLASMLAQVVNRVEWLRSLVDFAFPPLCLGCGSFYDGDEDVCESCLHRIDCFEYPICLTCSDPIEQGTSCSTCGEDTLPLFAYGNYVDPLKQIIINFKFRGITTPARLLSGLLADRFANRIKGIGADLLVPISLHPAREYQRGYNQAALLGTELSQSLDIICDPNRLVRIKKRKPQARLRRKDRSENIRNVFDAGQPNNGHRVIIIDDVVTSGATVREAARVLTESGHKVVAVIAVAHGL